MLRRSVSIPRGFAGARPDYADARSVRELMREKLIASASLALGSERAARVAELVEDLEGLSPDGVARLFDLACVAPPARSETERGYSFLSLEDESFTAEAQRAQRLAGG